jgi:hypothetical protein
MFDLVGKSEGIYTHTTRGLEGTIVARQGHDMEARCVVLKNVAGNVAGKM